jgi:hypothetical protein
MKKITKYFFSFGLLALVISCSKDTPNTETKKIQYLGDRILSAAVDGIDATKKYAPQFSEFKKIFPECQFKPINTDEQLQTARCQIANADKAREGKSEEFTVTITHARAGVSSVEFSGSNLYHVPDSLFFNLKDVDIKELSCPDIEQNNGASYNTKFYSLSRSGKSYGIFREVFSGGSGGNKTNSTFYYGEDSAPCSWSIENDQKIMKEFKESQNTADSGRDNNAPLSVADKKFLKEDEKTAMEFLETAAFCAGFYSGNLKNTSKQDCSAGASDNLGTNVTRVASCTAYLSNEYYQQQFKGFQSNQGAVGNYIRNNKNLFDSKYQNGRIVGTELISNPSKTAQSEFAKGRNECTRYMSFMRENFR